MELIGTIKLNNTVMMSDPCYGLGTWCQHILQGVKSGTYKCYAHYFYDKNWDPTYRRVGYIMIRHEDYTARPNIKADCSIGIDSGSCGIYDLEYFKKYHRSYNEREPVDDDWYDSIIDNIHLKKPNPNYVKFEDSEYYSSEYDWRTIFRMEEGDEKEKSIKKLLDQEREYNIDRDISDRTISLQNAYCRDDKCIISASAYGDGGAKVTIGKNNEQEIVSIKLSFK